MCSACIGCGLPFGSLGRDGKQIGAVVEVLAQPFDHLDPLVDGCLRAIRKPHITDEFAHDEASLPPVKVALPPDGNEQIRSCGHH
jgi:hypothetical protein